MTRSMKPSSRNTSGYRGVSKSGKRWVASIYAYGRSYHLGTFDTAEQAAVAYQEERERLIAAGVLRSKHGENPGRDQG